MKKRILFMIETVTLAHIARSTTLALSLDPREYEIIFAYGEASPFVLSTMGNFKLLQLRTAVKSKDFIDSIAKGKIPYDLNRVFSQVEEDIQVMRNTQPDLVVGDFRLSLAISARVMKVPYINISNSTWTTQGELQIPDIPLVKMIGSKAALMIFKLIQPTLYKQMAKPYNKVARNYGLPALGSLYDVYTAGDRTLFADIPGLVKGATLDKHQIEIGPIQFTPEIQAPLWLSSLSPARPMIYVNMGSSGTTKNLKTIIDTLTDLPVNVVVGLAGAKLELPLKPNLFVADYLPSTTVLDKASLFIGNGGSASCYLALMRGVPVLSVPSNIDQMQYTAALEKWNVSKRIRIEDVTTESIRDNVIHLLQDSGVKAALVDFKKRTNMTNAPAFFEAIVSSVLHGDSKTRELQIVTQNQSSKETDHA